MAGRRTTGGLRLPVSPFRDGSLATHGTPVQPIEIDLEPDNKPPIRPRSPRTIADAELLLYFYANPRNDPKPKAIQAGNNLSSTADQVPSFRLLPPIDHYSRIKQTTLAQQHIPLGRNLPSEPSLFTHAGNPGQCQHHGVLNCPRCRARYLQDPSYINKDPPSLGIRNGGQATFHHGSVTKFRDGEVLDQIDQAPHDQPQPSHSPLSGPVENTTSLHGPLLETPLPNSGAPSHTQHSGSNSTEMMDVKYQCDLHEKPFCEQCPNFVSRKDGVLVCLRHGKLQCLYCRSQTQKMYIGSITLEQFQGSVVDPTLLFTAEYLQPGTYFDSNVPFNAAQNLDERGWHQPIGCRRLLGNRNKSDMLIYIAAYAGEEAIENGRPPTCAFVFDHFPHEDPFPPNTVVSPIESSGPWSQSDDTEIVERVYLRTMVAALQFHNWRYEGRRRIIFATDWESFPDLMRQPTAPWFNASKNVKHGDLWRLFKYEYGKQGQGAGVEVCWWKITTEQNRHTVKIAKDAWGEARIAKSQFVALRGCHKLVTRVEERDFYRQQKQRSPSRLE